MTQMPRLQLNHEEKEKKMSGRGGAFALMKRSRRMSWSQNGGGRVVFQLSHHIW